jgi:serine/threonine-protein kinase
MMLSTAPLARSMPKEIGPYRLVGQLGRGGMGMVYEGVRRGVAGFERPVVIKVMDPDQSNDPDFVELFKGEARVLAGLNHPNIVQVQDFGVHDGQFYLVLERLEGCDLLRLLRAVNGPLPAGIALRIAVQVAEALGHAHTFVEPDGSARQIIHRDISPSNVFVGADGTVKVLDFGVAKVLSACELHNTQTYRGKFGYMAPEQLEAQPFDCRVDVFALGVLLHEMLTGRRLFHRIGIEETVKALQAFRVTPPSMLLSSLPPEVDMVVMTALARDPNLRYKSGVELAEALDGMQRLMATRRGLAGFVAHHVGAREPSGRQRTQTPTPPPTPPIQPTPAELLGEASLSVEIEDMPVAIEPAPAATEPPTAPAAAPTPRPPAADDFDAATVLDPPREFSLHQPIVNLPRPAPSAEARERTARAVTFAWLALALCLGLLLAWTVHLSR